MRQKNSAGSPFLTPLAGHFLEDLGLQVARRPRRGLWDPKDRKAQTRSLLAGRHWPVAPLLHSNDSGKG